MDEVSRLLAKSRDCIIKADFYAKSDEQEMFQFWLSAATGFVNRAGDVVNGLLANRTLSE